MQRSSFAAIFSAFILASLVEAAPLPGLLRQRDPETDVNRCRPLGENKCTLAVTSSLIGEKKWVFPPHAPMLTLHS